MLISVDYNGGFHVAIDADLVSSRVVLSYQLLHGVYYQCTLC